MEFIFVFKYRETIISFVLNTHGDELLCASVRLAYPYFKNRLPLEPHTAKFAGLLLSRKLVVVLRVLRRT